MLKIIGYSALIVLSGIALVLMLVANWPLGTTTWWGIGALIMVGGANIEIQNAKERAAARHQEVMLRLRQIEARLGARYPENPNY